VNRAIRRAAAVATASLWAPIAAAQVTVTDAWVRGTVEGQTATAAYMTLHSDHGARLVSIASTAAARCSLHQMTRTDNVMRMRTLEVLPIPAGGSADLKEGGDHVMLEGLTRPLKAGDTVRLTLTLIDAAGTRRTVDVQASVRALGAPSSPTAR
jgi:periplasmic copper chaperone A